MCGVVGVYGSRNVFKATFEALDMLQHRGDEGFGAIFSNGEKFVPSVPFRMLGHVRDMDKKWVGPKPTRLLLGVGHLRYGTAGRHTSLENVQPFLLETPFGPFCIGHNGDTPNVQEIRSKLLAEGEVFNATSDTEVIGKLIVREPAPTLKDAIMRVLSRLKASFALVMATPQALIAARDPWGNRPLSIARLGKGYVFASEPCAFDVIHAQYVRDVEPGELIWIDHKGLTSHRFAKAARLQQCIFELIYFSRADNKIFGVPVNKFHEALGRKLAEEYGPPTQKDVVISWVPDSGEFMAQGYARAIGYGMERVLMRHHFSGRTFILPGQKARDRGVKLKFNPLKEVVRGKWIVLIDDSIVRGTTMRRLVRMLRRAGATGVTVLIASPQILWSCFYGIDINKETQRLIASVSRGDVEAIRTFIEADDLCYLSMDGLSEVIRQFAEPTSFCKACFNGEYVI